MKFNYLFLLSLVMATFPLLGMKRAHEEMETVQEPIAQYQTIEQRNFIDELLPAELHTQAAEYRLMNHPAYWYWLMQAQKLKNNGQFPVLALGDSPNKGKFPLFCGLNHNRTSFLFHGLNSSGTKAITLDYGTVKIWDIKTRECLHKIQITDNYDWLVELLLNPNDTILASRSCHTIFLWDVASGKKIKEFTTSNPCSLFAFTPQALIYENRHAYGKPEFIAWNIASDSLEPLTEKEFLAIDRTFRITHFNRQNNSSRDLHFFNPSGDKILKCSYQPTNQADIMVRDTKTNAEIFSTKINYVAPYIYAAQLTNSDNAIVGHDGSPHVLIWELFSLDDRDKLLHNPDQVLTIDQANLLIDVYEFIINNKPFPYVLSNTINTLPEPIRNTVRVLIQQKFDAGINPQLLAKN